MSTNAPQMPPPVGPCSLPGPPAAVPACEQGSRSARAADGSGGANPTRAAKRERTHLAVRRFPRSEPAASTACGRYSCVLPSCTWKAGTIRGSPGGGNLVEIFRGGGSPAGSGRADFLPALFYFDSRTAPGCALTAPAPPPPRGHPCPGPRRTSLCREGARRALTSRREAARGGRSPPRDPTAGPLRGLHWAGRAAPLGDLRSFPAPAHGERFAPEPARPGPGPARRARTREGTTGGPSSPPRGLPRPARAPRPDPTNGRREGGNPREWAKMTSGREREGNSPAAPEGRSNEGRNGGGEERGKGFKRCPPPPFFLFLFFFPPFFPPSSCFAFPRSLSCLRDRGGAGAAAPRGGGAPRPRRAPRSQAPPPLPRSPPASLSHLPFPKSPERAPPAPSPPEPRSPARPSPPPRRRQRGSAPRRETKWPRTPRGGGRAGPGRGGRAQHAARAGGLPSPVGYQATAQRESLVRRPERHRRPAPEEAASGRACAAPLRRAPPR